MQAAEAGNLEEFVRLYQFDNQRLFVKDVKGRQVAHQAAARNKVNILQFIQQQGGGKREAEEKFNSFIEFSYNCKVSHLSKKTTFYPADLNCQDNLGNTPLHVAVENDSFEAIDFLLEM